MEGKTAIEPFEAYGDPTKVCQRWLTWKRNFMLYLATRKMKTEEQQLALLLFSAGTDVQKIYYQKKESRDAKQEEGIEIISDYVEAWEILDEAFVQQKNESFQRSVFRKISQGKTETIIAFVTRLREQAKFCDFGSEVNLEKAVIDQIVEKGSSTKLRQELWKKDRNLNEVIALAQKMENAELYEKIYDKLEVKEEKAEVNWVRDDRKAFRKRRYEDVKPSTSKSGGCWACGKEGHIKTDKDCPARGKSCMKCHKKGHFSVGCRSKDENSKKIKSEKIRAVESDVSDDDGRETDYVFKLGENSADQIECKVGGVLVSMIIDSGTKRNLIPLKVWLEMKESKVKVLEQIKGSDVKLKAYGEQKEIPVKGRFKADLEVNGIKSQPWFYVAEKGDTSLLGKISSEKHNVLQTGLGLINLSVDGFPKMKGNFMDKWV